MGHAILRKNLVRDVEPATIPQLLDESLDYVLCWLHSRAPCSNRIPHGAGWRKHRRSNQNPCGAQHGRTSPNPVRYAAAGAPNQVLSASASPGWVRSPTQATYPSGRINTAVGAATSPIAGSSHVTAYWALMYLMQSVRG